MIAAGRALVKGPGPLHYYPAMGTAAAIRSGLLAVATLALATAAGAAPRVIGTDEIAPGMRGHGLTVFSGTEPERFEVEVVAVVPNFLVRQPIILVRCSHPVIDEAGIIGGMSGSPVYLDGRLAGAVAYGWKFAKEPIAGVTPASHMYEVLERPQHAAASGGLARILRPFDSRLDGRGPAPDPYFGRFDFGDPSRMAPARTPISLSGFAPEAADLIAGALAGYGMDPVQGGGGGGEGGPDRFEPGGPIGVQLVRGDMSATGIGTVTAVEGDRVLAFGHPMFNMGEARLPVSTATIHTVIASLVRSNKIGSPLVEAGTLVQDRQAGIMARTDSRAPAIPVTIDIEEPRSRHRERYEVEMVGHPLLTPKLLQAVIASAVRHGASDASDVTVEIEGRMRVSGRDPVTLYDSGISRAGLLPLAKFFRPVDVVATILDNPFEEATAESLDFDIELRYGLDVATIVGAYLTAESPEPGDLVSVHVRLRMYDGEERILTVPIRIPEAAAGEKVQIEVAGGDLISPVMPAPQSLDDLIANVGRFYPPRSLVVGVNVPGEGVALRGRVIERLPPSAVTALRPAAGFDQVTIHRTAIREVVETEFLVTGKETIKIDVAPRRNR